VITLVVTEVIRLHMTFSESLNVRSYIEVMKYERHLFAEVEQQQKQEKDENETQLPETGVFVAGLIRSTATFFETLIGRGVKV
jgi:hypothetical protein